MIAHYVGRWSQGQQEQLLLCETIDQIADKLPLHDPQALERLAGQLTRTLDRLHIFEEQDLFPVLEAMSPQMRPLLVTFRTHHAKDVAAARALADTLAGQAAMTAQDLKDLRFELECFSETLRRHVQFEEAIAMALFASKRVDERRAVQ